MAEKKFTSTLKFVESVIKVITDKESAEYFTKLVDSIRNADGLDIDPADEDRRVAQLNFNAISLANQVVFTAFTENVLTKELEDEFRNLEALESAKESLKTETEKAMAEEEELNDKLTAFRERGRKYDLVHAVCGGRSVKEAKAMQKQFDEQVKGAQA